MGSETLFAPGRLFGFLFVLARVAGIFVFVPIPGVKDGPESVRAILAFAVTVALYPLWPRVPGDAQGMAALTAVLFGEAAVGLTIGLAVAFVTECMQMAAQVAGLQAGYGYASTVDPSSQADSSVLLVFAQLFAGLLFFATGLDREVIRVCAQSLQTFPPGRFLLSSGLADGMIRLSSGVFSMGLRLALPVVALLGMVDLSLALLGRLNSQLQLLTLAFPIKMLAALVLLAVMGVLFERVFSQYSGQVVQFLRTVLIR